MAAPGSGRHAGSAATAFGDTVRGVIPGTGACALRAMVVAVAVGAGGCGTVDPGQDVQFAEVSFDQGYFYCKVEPMLFAQRCGPGDTARGDAAGGCHFNVTPFRLTDHEPVPCRGLVPEALATPSGAQSNYQAAARQMSPDPARAPLLNRPTRRASHPREVFPSNSPEAEIIRGWATKYSSQ